MKIFSFIQAILLFTCSLSVSCSEDRNITEPPRELEHKAQALSLEIIKQHQHKKSQSLQADLDGDGRNEHIYLVDTKYFSIIEEGLLNRHYPNMIYAGRGERKSKNHKVSEIGYIIDWSSRKKPQFSLVFDFDEYPILDTEIAKIEMHVISHQKPNDELEPELLEKAKGDIIVLPTEASVDMYLYYNGENFYFFHSLEIP